MCVCVWIVTILISFFFTVSFFFFLTFSSPFVFSLERFNYLLRYLGRYGQMVNMECSPGRWRLLRLPRLSVEYCAMCKERLMVMTDLTFNYPQQVDLASVQGIR